MGKKPVIVIAPEDVNDAFGIVFIMNKEYGDCIREAGGIPMGAGDYRAAADYADFGDALLIPGGPDIHMARYGQYFTDSAEIASFSNTRDDFDFALCEAFLKAGKPILGIGRGAQVLNVALGGTLIRNIGPHLTADCHVTGHLGNTYAVLDGTPGVFTHKNGVHKIRLECRLEGKTIEIAVTDFGKGIPDIPKAMEPLFTTGGEERAGLGFAVMQSFCDRVTVRSTLGKGTSVTLQKNLLRRERTHD